MEVRLVSYSKPTEHFEAEGLENAQDLVAFCAKVSNPNAQINKKTSSKLIKYLIKHKHWSPLEMVSACLEITTTRDIARQILRHRSFSFQEFSQRYANPTEDLSFEFREARLQDPKNRQNSIELDLSDMGKGGNKTQHELLAEKWRDKQLSVVTAATEAYTLSLIHI